MTRPSSRPDSAAIRRALAECMTLADIDDAMGWSPGTARRRRWNDPERGGLPPSDAELGGVVLWFRATIEEWRTTRRGRSRRLAGTGAEERREPGPGAGPQRPETELAATDEAGSPEPGADERAAPAAAGAAVPEVAVTEAEATEAAVTEAAVTKAEASEAEGREADGPEAESSEAADVEPDEEEPGTDTGEDDEEEGEGAEEIGEEDAEDAFAEPEGGGAEEPGPAPVTSGFDLEPGEEVLAHVHRAWRPAVVVGRDRRTVMVGYNIDGTRLGARQQRVSLDRVRRLPV